jgi:hypothetical protein
MCYSENGEHQAVPAFDSPEEEAKFWAEQNKKKNFGPEGENTDSDAVINDAVPETEEPKPSDFYGA